MTISERLEEIQVRYSEWHSDRGDHTPAPDTDTWSDADHPDESMEHCIVRNDVPALVAALRAVLDLHKPDEFSDPPICGCCSYVPTEDDEHYFEAVALYVDYPCPTVKAVAAVLDNN